MSADDMLEPCHREHTYGFTGNYLGRNEAGGAWESCDQEVQALRAAVQRVRDLDPCHGTPDPHAHHLRTCDLRARLAAALDGAQ